MFRLQSTVMLVFREEKSPEDEAKAWQFWHGRQHSVKQRILDAGKQLDIHLLLLFFLSRLTCDHSDERYMLHTMLVNLAFRVAGVVLIIFSPRFERMSRFFLSIVPWPRSTTVTRQPRPAFPNLEFI